jgi:hypothetical protein
MPNSAELLGPRVVVIFAIRIFLNKFQSKARNVLRRRTPVKPAINYAGSYRIMNLQYIMTAKDHLPLTSEFSCIYAGQKSRGI